MCQLSSCFQRIFIYILHSARLLHISNLARPLPARTVRASKACPARSSKSRKKSASRRSACANENCCCNPTPIRLRLIRRLLTLAAPVVCPQNQRRRPHRRPPKTMPLLASSISIIIIHQQLRLRRLIRLRIPPPDFSPSIRSTAATVRPRQARNRRRRHHQRPLAVARCDRLRTPPAPTSATSPTDQNPPAAAALRRRRRRPNWRRSSCPPRRRCARCSMRSVS